MHAENDDDARAIAAMTRALAAEPGNLDVLLSLSVSHTNELDSKEALGARFPFREGFFRVAHFRGWGMSAFGGGTGGLPFRCQGHGKRPVG